MSEMGDWLNQLHMRIPEAGMDTPSVPAPEGGTRTPETPAPAAPETPAAPAAPATPGRAPLDAFLRYLNAGNDTLTPELYAYFGGDEILKEMQKYDPGYHWEDVDSGGGEGATMYKGKKLVGSTPGQFVAPASASGIDLLNLRPANFSSDGLKNPNAVFHDDLYGDVTHSSNILTKQGTLDKALPYIAALIAMGGPALGGALAGAGIGGGAGFTSAVTGGAAGLPAASIPATNAATAPWWAKSAVRGGPGALNTGKQLYDQSVWAPPIGGSAPKTGAPTSGDSSLTANNFAEDPYGFTRRGF